VQPVTNPPKNLEACTLHLRQRSVTFITAQLTQHAMLVGWAIIIYAQFNLGINLFYVQIFLQIDIQFNNIPFISKNDYNIY